MDSFLNFSERKLNQTNLPIKLSNFGEILGDSIKNATYSILTIGGFVVLFSVIISILNTAGLVSVISSALNKLGIPSLITESSITSLIELTNGLNLLSLAYLNYPIITILLISFFLGFGGISVFLQVYSIISKENISIKPYLIGKVLQGLFSVAITFILI